MKRDIKTFECKVYMLFLLRYGNNFEVIEVNITLTIVVF